MTGRGDDERWDYEAILEGRCPKHGTPLERRDDHGWCEACGLGHSMTWDGHRKSGTYGLHLQVRIPPSLRSGGFGSQP